MIERHEVAALVPAFQEEEFIGEVVSRLHPHVGSVLVVDDGSRDQTAQRATRAGAQVIRHELNRGKGAAIKTGLKALLEEGCTYVILLDGDGQHLPEEVPLFVQEAARTGARVVLGNRMSNVREMPWLRRAVNRLMSWKLSRVCGQRIPDSQCGFRLLHREIIPQLFCSSDAFQYESEMLLTLAGAGEPISSVPITTVYRQETSKIRPLRDTVRFVSMLRRHSHARVCVAKSKKPAARGALGT